MGPLGARAMSIDVAAARAVTPGCEHVAHFNNAGAALMPECVSSAVHEHLDLESRRGGYEAARQRQRELNAVYTSAAALLGCADSEVAYVENATRGWQLAFYSLPLSAGDRVLTSQSEYASNYIAFLQLKRRAGIEVEVVDNDADGALSLIDLARRLERPRAKLVAISHVPTNGGLVQPAAEIGALTQRAGAYYLLDACQSAGQIPLGVDELRCDFLSLTGRKYLRGPRGTGLLYVRQQLCAELEPAFLDLHAAEWVADDDYRLAPGARRFECWESNVAAKLGLGAAIDHALSWGLGDIEQRVGQLAEQLRRGLSAVGGVRVRDLGRRRSGIVTFDVDGCAAAELLAALSRAAINCSLSNVSSTRLDMQARGLSGLVRASVHYYNTETEVERLVSEVWQFAQHGG